MEAVASQPPVVSEAAVVVTPVAGGAAITVLPSVVQDLARFFLGLSGSSSLGATGDIAGVTASAAASRGIACPAIAAGGAATNCATAVTPTGAGVSPAAPAAVPGVSGEQQLQVESRSRGRRSRSSSDGTDRRAKKRSRRRSPSPGRSSRRRGRRYRSSSDSSEEDRADVSPPRSRRAHGGAQAGGRSPGIMISRLVLGRRGHMQGRTDTGLELVVDPLGLRAYAREDRYRSGAGRRSPGPSGICKGGPIPVWSWSSIPWAFGHMQGRTDTGLELVVDPLGLRAYAREDRYRSGAGRRSPGPSGICKGGPIPVWSWSSTPWAFGHMQGRTDTGLELVVDPLGLRAYAREDRYRSGAGRRSPGPSGTADDDRSTTFESVDFARDDSFRAVLGLIREFHDMAEPAGVPAARCKTSLASAYGLMSETSPAFTLPASPLLTTLLSDINLALSKFLEDQTVHGFLPVPGRRHRRYYSTSSSSFPGPYTVPPGVTSITLEKASEMKKRSVSLSASQVSSMETMLLGMCEVSSWLDWWLSTCGGFRDHLPIEVRADFERLMISGSRALEFLASQGMHDSWQSRSCETRCPAGRCPWYGPGGGSCAFEIFSSTSDGVYLPTYLAGLRSAQDARCC